MSKKWTAFAFALLLVACSGDVGAGKPSDEGVIAAWVEQLKAEAKAKEDHAKESDVAVGPVLREGLKVTIPWTAKCQRGNFTGTMVLTVTDVKIIPVPESSMQPYRATITATKTKEETGSCPETYEFRLPVDRGGCSSWSAETKTWGKFQQQQSAACMLRNG